MSKTNMSRFFICLALIATQFAIPRPVKACSCAESGIPVDEFMQSAAVFTGKVKAISTHNSPITSLLGQLLSRVNLNPNYLYRYAFWGNEITFAVLKSWKGVTTTSVNVRTGTGGGDCGYLFNQGSDYLVYAYEWNDPVYNGLGTGICSRTSEISRAIEDLSYLNTLSTLPLAPVYDYSWWYFAGAALFVLAVLSLIATVLIRRRRQRQSTGEQL